jgi:hypothetical protein
MTRSTGDLADHASTFESTRADPVQRSFRAPPSAGVQDDGRLPRAGINGHLGVRPVKFGPAWSTVHFSELHHDLTHAEPKRERAARRAGRGDRGGPRGHRNTSPGLRSSPGRRPLPAGFIASCLPINIRSMPAFRRAILETQQNVDRQQGNLGRVPFQWAASESAC